MKNFTIAFNGKEYAAVELTWWYRSEEHTMVFAEDLLYDDLFVNRDSDEFKSKDAENLFNEIEFFTENAHHQLCESEFINALCEENSDYKEIFNKDVLRRCSICGKVMDEGYMDNWSDWHACSDECRDKYYAETGESLEDDEIHDACFYTEWETPFYEW